MSKIDEKKHQHSTSLFFVVVLFLQNLVTVRKYIIIERDGSQEKMRVVWAYMGEKMREMYEQDLEPLTGHIFSGRIIIEVKTPDQRIGHDKKTEPTKKKTEPTKEKTVEKNILFKFMLGEYLPNVKPFAMVVSDHNFIGTPFESKNAEDDYTCEKYAKDIEFTEILICVRLPIFFEILKKIKASAMTFQS